MIRRLLLAVAATLSMSVAAAVPANASCPGETTGIKFWTHSICMAVGDTTIEAPYMAQQWNTQGGMAIQASSNCVSAGYPASRRFTIDTYYEVSGTYWKVRDPDGSLLYDDSYDYYNGYQRYINNPVLWVNLYHLASQTRRHNVGAAIGNLIGLTYHNSSGYNSRIMNLTDWSQLNVPYVDSISGGYAESIYNGDC